MNQKVTVCSARLIIFLIYLNVSLQHTIEWAINMSEQVCSVNRQSMYTVYIPILKTAIAYIHEGGLTFHLGIVPLNVDHW